MRNKLFIAGSLKLFLYAWSGPGHNFAPSCPRRYTWEAFNRNLISIDLHLLLLSQFTMFFFFLFCFPVLLICPLGVHCALVSERYSVQGPSECTSVLIDLHGEDTQVYSIFFFCRLLKWWDPLKWPCAKCAISVIEWAKSKCDATQLSITYTKLLSLNASRAVILAPWQHVAPHVYHALIIAYAESFSI